MAILRASEIREMNAGTIDEKLVELKGELNSERGKIESGGRASNPGRIKEIKKTIARLITIKQQKATGKVPEAKKKAPKPKEEKKQEKKAEKSEEKQGKGAKTDEEKVENKEEKKEEKAAETDVKKE